MKFKYRAFQGLALSALVQVAYATNQKECEINVRRGFVAKLPIPIGAATTLELPAEFKFAVPGNRGDFAVTPIDADQRTIVVMVKSSNAQSTSLTLGLKSGSTLNLWLQPTSKQFGCVYAHIRRTL